MRTMLLPLALSLLPSLAAADPDVQKMASDDCALARKMNKTCVLTIDDKEDVVGDRPVSTESQIIVNTFINHASLISIRRDFIPEILNTAEDL
jgi:hypothetical protein